MDPGQTLLLGGEPRAPEAFLHWEGGLDNNTHGCLVTLPQIDLKGFFFKNLHA